MELGKGNRGWEVSAGQGRGALGQGIRRWSWGAGNGLGKGVVELWQDCGCCSAQPRTGQQDLLEGGEGLHASTAPASALPSSQIPSGPSSHQCLVCRERQGLGQGEESAW